MHTARHFDRRMDDDGGLARLDELHSSGCALRVDKLQRGGDQKSRGDKSPHQNAQKFSLHRSPPLKEIESFIVPTMGECYNPCDTRRRRPRAEQTTGGRAWTRSGGEIPLERFVRTTCGPVNQE